MKSFVTEEFIEQFNKIPKPVQKQARKSYKIWLENPYHPSLQFKRIHKTESIWSVRIGLKWRVLGLLNEDSIY
ncbi:MAG: hypothetical protein A2X61_10665 [Ignavibacteria bacterium GWB2_35_12]|nr:MAG: hypothetical protein A2X63_12740 [Ignavibacteria bacterium GWA2_35_8]OGU42695.1 MAG: hypothetical protein A2X61_10665 [Ignavibacteria bacterium GWB2_35_12]OGU89368.1 MAG: hypothetical protein A2220_01100 [Ignavibacteria bacterium RIFOXYA2_FULL_35_10]OGV19289.1 MAG: hypothetical protein A2475_03835 [Ignavibacteria bacterium RIFOXYC2_FULL_35_21]